MIARLLCRLLGHRYHCSILEEVDGQLWATKEQCTRCGDVVPNTYYPVARLQWELSNDRR